MHEINPPPPPPHPRKPKMIILENCLPIFALQGRSCFFACWIDYQMKLISKSSLLHYCWLEHYFGVLANFVQLASGCPKAKSF